MVFVNPNPLQKGSYLFDPMDTGQFPVVPNSLPPSAPNSAFTTAGANSSEDPTKKVRKPYTITKSRESWTEQEHDKFLEALQLFDRDWKKIEAFVGSKTVIQIRSHTQKYFLKVQKSGTSEHVPPPRPKRKASHPYPQKASKNAPVALQNVTGPYQSSSAILSSWSCNSAPPLNVAQATKDDVKLAGPTNDYCCSSSTESTPRTWQNGEAIDQADQSKSIRVMPDFAQVYSFIGSVFDPNTTGHLQRLKQMDPINLETACVPQIVIIFTWHGKPCVVAKGLNALVLMRNLAINLTSPEFEDHVSSLCLYPSLDLDSKGDAPGFQRKLISSYADFEKLKSSSDYNSPCTIRSDGVALSKSLTCS